MPSSFVTFSTSPDRSNLAYTNERVYQLHRTDSIGSLIKRFAAKKAGVEEWREINNQRKAFLDMLAWSEN